jgi:symplekin
MNFTLDSGERQHTNDETDDAQFPIDEMAITTFELPLAEKLSPQILRQEFQASIDRILQSIRAMDKSISYRAGISNKSISLDSIAITEWDKEAWITLLSRLSARGLGQPEPSTKGHLDSDTTGMGNSLRERLFEYIMINFRDHMDLAIAWLTEEWYNDKLTSESSGVYAKWATRIFDNILPFIEAKDMRIFIRFLGDLPLIMPAHVNKLRILCLDPERQKLGFAAIKYLLLLRPPARIACIELCTDLYRNRISPNGSALMIDADTKKSAADILKRWAPGTVE